MLDPQRSITVYEYSTLRVGTDLTEDQFNSLAAFKDRSGREYFTLLHKGIRFNSFVGILQVGSTLIEILPKADRDGNEEYWRSMLIGMLRAAGIMKVDTPSASNLRLKPNALLDIYIELFIKEVEYLLHRGLAKMYRRTEGNNSTFKGSIVFSKHIQQNVVHQERMYSRSTVFDNEHVLHKILYKALRLLTQICTSSKLHSRIGNLLLNFPEMPDVRVDNKLFEKISLVRRTAHYSKALQIARLLLLNYHPDIQSGRNSVLALLFDMNVVWEKFIFKTLQRKLDHSEYSVKEQVAMDFWKPRQGNSVRIKPDIVLKNEGKTYVIDTKWKTLDKAKVDMADLRQMFVYHKYFEAPLVAILYPGSSNNLINGSYSEPGLSEKPECTLMPVDIGESITIWQQVIASTVINWMKA